LLLLQQVYPEPLDNSDLLVFPDPRDSLDGLERLVNQEALDSRVRLERLDFLEGPVPQVVPEVPGDLVRKLFCH